TLFRATGVFRAGLLGKIKRRPNFAWSYTFFARAAVQAQTSPRTGVLLFRVPQTQSAFHRHAQRNASRRDVRQRCAHWNPRPAELRRKKEITFAERLRLPRGEKQKWPLQFPSAVCNQRQFLLKWRQWHGA